MENKNTKRICSIVWTVACIGIVFAMAYKKYIGYEVIDDFYLSIFPSGFWGDYSSYSVHNNVILSLIFKVLNLCLPQIINWTIGFMVLGIILGYVFFGIYAICSKGVYTGLTISIVFFISTFYTMLYHFNYSKTGAFIMIVGAILLTDRMITQKDVSNNKLVIIIGIVMIVMGGLYRIQTTISTLPFVALLCLLSIRKKKVMKTKTIVTIWGIVFASVLALWGVNYISYHANDDWGYYKDYDYVRTKVLDYPNLPAWSDNRQLYEELGWSENDLKMLQEWNFADDSVFSIEAYESILDFVKERTNNRSTLWDIIYRMKVIMIDYLLIIFVFFLAIILLLLLPEYQYFILLDVGVMVVELVYLCYVARYPERAVMIPTVCAFAILLFIYTKATLISKRNTMIVAVVMIGLSLGVSEIYALRSYGSYPYRNREDNLAFLNELSSNKDNLYIWSVVQANNLFMDTFGPLDCLETGLFDNSVFAGGWAALTPTSDNIILRYGNDNNIMKLLAQNDNVFYVDVKEYSDSVITQYIREHYNPNVICRLVESKYGYYIYSFSDSGK